MILSVKHRTVYAYESPVTMSHHVLRVLPRRTASQVPRSAELTVDPVPDVMNSGRDWFRNPIAYATVQQDHRRFEVTAESIVEVTPAPAPADDIAWDTVPAALLGDRSAGALTAWEYLFDSPLAKRDPAIRAYAETSFPPGRPLLEAVDDLTRRIHTDFAYLPGVTDVSTPVAEVLETRAGVCQDFAHLQIACLRAMGLPARYVSGWLLTAPPPGAEKLIGADASHAWVGVWTPSGHWVDVDPTNDCRPGGSHVVCGWGRDYADVSPIDGVIYGGGAHTVHVAVDVAETTLPEDTA